MPQSSNIRELAKIRANVEWMRLHDPMCPRSLSGLDDGRPSLDPVKWGRIKGIDEGMIVAVGLTARNKESYVRMHCLYGLVLGIFRLATVVTAGVCAYYRVWHTAWMFGVVFIFTFALPKFLVYAKRSNASISQKEKEQ
jgi:hypothetical protein